MPKMPQRAIVRILVDFAPPKNLNVHKYAEVFAL